MKNNQMSFIFYGLMIYSFLIADVHRKHKGKGTEALLQSGKGTELIYNGQRK